jgi:riboflavin-specific deaminase-like protein
MKIVINIAVSLDGKIVTNDKELSDKIDFQRVYALRPKFDAILVGANTIVKDDPRLTSKGLGKDPIPVVLDRQGLISKNARIHQRNPIIITSKKKGFPNEIITADFSWTNIKKILANNKIKSIIVEGGGKVIRSLILENAWDEFYIYYAPLFCGNSPELPSFINGLLKTDIKATIVSVKKQGEGVLIKLASEGK